MAQDKAAFEENLARVLRREIEGCRGLKSAERLSGGASQETYRVVIDTAAGERRLAMRRAPGGVFLEERLHGPGLATEALLMQCAKQVGVPEPEVYYVLKREDDLGEGFLMEWLDGEALGAKIARAPEFEGIRRNLAFECGQILARIHGIDLKATGLDKLLDRANPEEIIRGIWARYQEFGTPQPMIDYAARWLLERVPEAPEVALVHNDFRNGNFMVNEQGINAVLDWEIAQIGDPMRDLGWLCTNSWRFGKTELPVGGFGEYEDLFRGYESVSGKPVDADRVKFWVVFGSYNWATGCLGMAEHYRTGPDKTVERPGIGRRSSECQVDCVNLLIPGPAELVDERDPADVSDEMPRLDELLVSVRDYLHGDVMAATEGRLNFLARVAGNSLDVVLRDLLRGETHRGNELARLRRLFDSKDDLKTLRWRLTHGLRDGSIALDMPGLAEHLRATVVNQVAIDQPKYSGLRTALAYGA